MQESIASGPHVSRFSSMRVFSSREYLSVLVARFKPNHECHGMHRRTQPSKRDRGAHKYSVSLSLGWSHLAPQSFEWGTSVHLPLLLKLRRLCSAKTQSACTEETSPFRTTNRQHSLHTLTFGLPTHPRQCQHQTGSSCQKDPLPNELVAEHVPECTHRHRRHPPQSPRSLSTRAHSRKVTGHWEATNGWWQKTRLKSITSRSQ